MTTLTAPAKIILFGEHAVVYGEPAIAVPITSLNALATIGSTDDGFKIVARDLDNTIIRHDPTETNQPLQRALNLLLNQTKSPLPDVTIEIRSTIPIASGLGSGAAVTTALLKAVTYAMDKAISLEALNNIVYEVEKIHHGTPSGIDNTVIVYEQPIFYTKNQPIKRMNIETPFHLIIADTGQAALTHVAVGDVRKLVESESEKTKSIISDIGELAQQARSAMENGDHNLLGKLMNNNHHSLQRLTVSSPELDLLVYAAIDAGALGAKLSGGGRGGNMIALVEKNTSIAVATALKNAGAARILHTIVS